MAFRLEFTGLMRALADLMYPRTCSFCGTGVPLAPDQALCSACREALVTISPPLCQKCGIPVHTLCPEGAQYCGKCLSSPRLFGSARYGFAYEAALRAAILRFKFAGVLSLGPTLTALFEETFERHFSSQTYDLMVPMPLHPRRLVERGFNQSAILADGLSKATGIPVDRISFRKVKDTPPQVGLTEAQRTANLRGSFAIFRPARFKRRRILLIDDVCTTGSTIAEAARTISRVEPASMDVLVLALRLSTAAAGPATAVGTETGEGPSGDSS